MPVEKGPRSRNRSTPSQEDQAQNKLNDLVDTIYEKYQNLQPNPLYFSVSTTKEGQTIRALIGLNDNEIYTETFAFWPEVVSGQLSTSILRLTDDHGGLHGYLETRIDRELGLIFVDEPSEFPIGDKLEGDVYYELWRAALNYKNPSRYVQTVEAAAFLGEIDYSSLKPLRTDPLV